MSNLLEIIGKAVTVDIVSLIIEWFDQTKNICTCESAGNIDRLSMIVDLIINKKFISAENQLHKFLSDHPSDVRGRLLAAAVFLNDNRIEIAIEQLNSVYFRQPNHTLALYVLGHCYERLGKENEALEFYQDCLKFKNYLQLPRQRISAIYFKNCQFEKTVEQYEKLRDEYPGEISTYLYLGDLYNFIGRYEQACDSFNKAILMNPVDNPEIFEIDQLMADNQSYQALEQISQMCEDNQENPELIAKYGDVLSKLGYTQEAIDQYERAIDISPDFLEATVKLAAHYEQCDNIERACILFERSAKINDFIVDSYIGLSSSAALSGKKKDALNTLSLASAILPNSTCLMLKALSLHHYYDFCTLTDENYDQQSVTAYFIEYYSNLLKSKPGDPNILHSLGVIYLQDEKYTDAIGCFSKAISVNPMHISARNKLTLCYFETNQMKKAFENLLHKQCFDEKLLNLHYKVSLLYCNPARFASSLLNLNRQFDENNGFDNCTSDISIVLSNLGLLDESIINENPHVNA